MTFLEILQKIHNNEACCFVRDFSTNYQNNERNGAYTVILSGDFDCRKEITTEDIFATDWEVYNSDKMDFVGDCYE